jgi:predicted nucleotidyltransferase
MLAEKDHTHYLLTVRGCWHKLLTEPWPFPPEDIAGNGTSGFAGRRGIDMVAELKERIADVVELCQRFNVQELHLFGSSTTASSVSEVGDLDFLVRFDDMLPVLYSNSYFGLAGAFRSFLAAGLIVSRRMRSVTRSVTRSSARQWKRQRNGFMAPPDVKKLLFDIHSAGELITSFIRGRSYEDYQRDRMLQSAVERQFEIIGEARRRALDIDPELEKKTSGTRRIIDFS